MNGKLGNKIIFEAGKILWPIALTFDLSILPYSYTDRHIQYSSKILKHLCHFPKFPVDVDLGTPFVSVFQNTRGSTIGKKRGTFQ